MIRTLRLSDLPGQVLTGGPKGPDLVCTRRGPPSGVGRLFLAHLVRDGLAPNRRLHALALVAGLRLLAVATVQRRSGPRAWELTHLRVSQEAWDSCSELLEHCSAYAATQGAERLFLRLREDSPLTAVAHRSGFFSSVAEVVYEGQGIASSAAPAQGELRPRAPGDDHAIFRLYNATTPPQVRSAYGLTLEQWRDAQEPLVERPCECVWEHEGKVVALARMSRRGRAATVEALVHPETPWAAPALTDFVRRKAGPKGVVVWPTPEYQTSVSTLLKKNGFRETARLLVLVKSMTERVRETLLVPANV
ncbi:MAG: hypothetical protein HYY00_00165 [Chloroflexi bacterium]|nr:hypothetical protein [Chloroflexota bacterium]